MKVAATCFTIACAVGAQAQITLDDFTTGAANLSVTSSQNYFEQSGSMIGGHRTVSMDVLTNPFSVPLDVDITSGGFASINQGSNMTSDDSLLYGYTATSQSSITTFDLAADLSSASAFELDVAYNQDAMQADIMLNNSSSSMFAFTIAATSTGTAYTINFSNFSGVNFADVHEIAVDFQDTNSNDFTLKGFKAVPEPASMAFLGLGLIGLIARKRKS